MQQPREDEHRAAVRDALKTHRRREPEEAVRTIQFRDPELEFVNPDRWIRAGRGLQDYLMWADHERTRFCNLLADSPLADRVGRFLDLVSEVHHPDEDGLRRLWQQSERQ